MKYLKFFFIAAIVISVSVAPFSASATFIQGQKIEASDGADGIIFGNTVAMSSDGSRMAIGAISAAGGNGAIYVFSRSGTTWTQEQKLTASDGAAGDQLGYYLSISDDGSRIASGANGHNSAAGAVYVFSRSGTTWTQEQKLTASDGAAGDVFSAVSISPDGTRLGAGAYVAGNMGAVYIFSRSGTTWTQEQKLTASDGATGDFFGVSVVLDEDASRVGIGSTSANADKGAVYVFSRSGTTWTQEQKLTASDGTSGDYFGVGLSISPDSSRIAIGANGASSQQGVAYVFSRSGTTWTQEQKLTASDGAATDAFGSANSVSLSEDATRLAIGAYGDNVSRGSAYLYSRSGTTWTQDQKLTASDAVVSDYFAYSLSFSSNGEMLGIGAAGVNNFEGAVYYFTFDAPPTVSTLSPLDNATNVAIDSNLVLTFSEIVDVESGNITIKKSSDNSTVETIAVGSTTGTGTTTITINPTNDLNYETEFYVNIDATAFDDVNSNSYAGIADATTWSFTTEYAPVLSSGSKPKNRSVVIKNDPQPAKDTPIVCGLGLALLKIGSKGEEVKCLQGLLNSKLNLQLILDGAFGPKTKAAAIAFQSLNNLAQDGLVGPKTKGAINSLIQ